MRAAVNKGKLFAIINIATLLFITVAVAWVIMFKANLIVDDLVFGVRSINLIPFRGVWLHEGFWLECLLNAVVYGPLGYMMAVVFNKVGFRWLAVIIVLSSVMFELLQYALAFGSTDITDVICNGLGGIVGEWIFFALHKRGLKTAIDALCCIGFAVGLPVMIYAIISTVTVFENYIIFY